MKHLIRLTDYTVEDYKEIFNLADVLSAGVNTEPLKGKTVVMFFPSNSIRTRVTFEKGIHLLGGQTLLFPTETLDKKESLKDVMGYLNNWADLVIIRHKNIKVLEAIARNSKVPVINAMTDWNHPCEILSDLYALSKRRSDFTKERYLFCGVDGNIGRTWKEASQVFGFSLIQCCPAKENYIIDGISVRHILESAIAGRDIICTDSYPQLMLDEFEDYMVTSRIMDMANEGALLNPCPPFYRGEEVSDEVIDSEYFVGYEFKKCLLEVQQAIICYLLSK